MEEKNNNALEKAENVAKRNASKNTSGKARIKEQRKKERMAQIAQRQAEREKIRAERERIQAERRVELARIKAHKKAEKQKAKATAIREKNRRKAELKARKQQLKAEKEARRQMIKSESKKERQRRIAMEKSARREERASKRREKRERRQRNKGVGGWLAAVISLGISTLVLASVLTFTFLMPTMSDNLLEATYQKSFYDTVAQVDNIDLNLSKVLATRDSGAIQKYLLDMAINSELAENDLQQLPLQDESKYYTTKLINQIGDYAKYLNNKIIAGEKLSSEDREGLIQLYQANLTLKNSLQNMTKEMGAEYSFSSLMAGGSGDLVISGFNQLQNLSVQYPELIYDGPFSDGQSQREVKGLSGGEIDEMQAKEEFKKVFAEYNLDQIESVGETNGDIVCYNIQGQSDGDTLYAQMSKKGGKLIMFSFAGSCAEVKIDDDTAVQNAQEFLRSLNITEMKPVWINLANNVYTINFAYQEDEVIVYSDLIKLRVCAETGMVIGLEAKSYYTNHTERVVSAPKLTEKQALAKVSDNIEIDTARLAIVPIGQKSEKLCYEFSGEYDGSTYYVYIDAITGSQVEMFKVIESTEGTLLM